MTSGFKNLFLALFLTGLAACSDGSGRDSNQAADAEISTGERIVNGVEVNPDDLPYIKRLYATFPDLGTGLCSGAFISPNHFLTAAHCIFSPTTGALPPELVQVEVEVGKFVTAAGIAIHPGYTGSPAESVEFPGLPYFPGDIAIVLVAEPFTGQPIPVSTRTPVPGQLSVIAGYGTTVTGAPSDQLLRGGAVPVDLVSASEGVIYWFFDSLAESNTCNGDSGGPQIVQFSSEEPFVLVGLTSGGGPTCELNSVSFNTLVPNYHDWINLVTGGVHLVF